MTGSALHLTIAGAGFRLHGDSTLSLAAAYQPFLSDPGHPATSPAAGTYQVVSTEAPALPAIQGNPFWENEIWRMGNTRDDRVALEILDVIRTRWVPVAHLDPDMTSGTIQPFYGRRADPGPHALNYPYDQAILIHALLRREVAVVHGAGLVLDGRGFVFFGPSGIGKTTTSRLGMARGAALLNDDRVALRPDGPGWRVCGTPWHGEEPRVSPDSAPLRGVVRLRQGPENRMRLLDPLEGLSELLACALIPFFQRAAIERAVDLLGRLQDSVPFWELTFRPEPAALDVLLNAAG